MNPWEEDWSGTSQKAPWEEDWSTQAPAPSPASTLRRVDILPPAENKVPKWAQSLPEFAQPMFADGEQKALESWRERVAYELRPGASGMEPTKAITQEDIDRIAINRWEQAGRQAPKKDIGQAVAGLAGFADIATFGLSDEFAALAPFERTLMETGSLEKAGQAFGEARQDYKALQSDATQQRPFSTRAGQTAALLAPGAKGYSMGMQAAPKLVPASVAAAVAGKSVPARLARYGGRLAAMTGIGALDYGLYNFAAEAPNQARVAGTEMPGVGDRLQFAGEEAITPTGLVAAAVPAIGSLGYRAGRGVVTAGKNTIEDTIAATRAAPRPEIAAQGVPLPQLRFRGGSFTPADVRGRVDLNTPDPATGRTPRQIAIDRLLDEGFSPDEAERAVRLLSYDGRANVNEMLFEIDNNLQEIGLAVGRINRPGRKILEEEFKARNEGMFDEIRQAIRRAVGASGDDLEDFNETMAKKAKEQSADGYAAAYGKQVSDDTWQKITGLLGDTPDGLDAARKGAELARNSARRDPAKLEAARQLDELADVLGSGGVPQTKLSTVALDFLDRGLRRKVDVAVRQGDNAYAASLLDFRNALRGSGLDAETGLNIPRTIYAQYQAAAKAAEFGERAAGKAVSLRQLKQQFLQAQRAADQALEEGIGEGSGIIDESLMMGWVRGTEDLIERADNPGTLIRQLYGSERQRQKMLDMLRELPETASPGLKADVTKDRKALVGSRGGKADYKFGFNLSTGERVEGRVPVRSLFDRQRDMLESQRVTVGGSPTGQVSDAIANQGGDMRRLERAFNFIEQAYKSPARLAVRIVDQMREPLIYQKAVNRELGELLSTRGREKLLSVIDEIRQRQLARSGGTPPAPGAPPRPPPVPPRGGGGAPAAAAQDDGFAQARQAGKVTPEERAMLFGDPGDVKAGGFVFRPRQTRAEPFNDPRLTPSENKAVEMRRNGLTVREMADEMDTSEDAVYKFIQTAKAKGVDVGEQGKDRVRDSILDLASKGIPQSAIAQRLGISSNNVKVILANARKQAGENAPDWLKPRALANGLPNAFRQDLGNAGAGALSGGLVPLPSTGDPQEDLRNRLAVMGGMAVAGAAGPRLAQRFGGQTIDGLSQGIGGRKPPKDSPEAIRAGVQKITQKLKSKGSATAAPQQPEMRVSKGMAKVTGIADNRELGAKAAREMLAAGRSPAEIFTATNHVPLTVDGKTIMVRAAGKNPDEVTAAFWQEMAKPVSRRADWIREQTKGIKPIGPNAVARQPLETRAQVATSIIRQKGERINPQAVWEETDMVVLMRGPNGQPVVSKSAVPVGSQPVSLIDGSGFKSWGDAMDYIKQVSELPRAQQPAWYRENFSDPLALTPDQALRSPQFEMRQFGEFTRANPGQWSAMKYGAAAGVGIPAGIAIGREYDRRNPTPPESMRVKLNQPPQR